MRMNDARTLSAEAQEDLRLRVVRAVVEEGMKKAEAVRTFQVSKTAVHNWTKGYAAHGAAALRAQKRGRPPESRLTGWQAATVVRLIRDRCPDQLKLPFALWTRAAVGELLERRFGLKVSVWTVGRYLAAWGFTPQKPLRRAYERDPEAVQKWLAAEYPVIRERARREQAVIHWGDAMGLRSDHQTGTSYGPRGRTPIIPGTGKRFGCNMFSAVTNRGDLSFMVFKERFTTPVFINFLRRLVRLNQRRGCRKSFLIVDSHPVHKSARVTRWVADRHQQIELFFLPGYSPELNPDELLNNDVKSNALGRQRPATQQQMMHLTRTYLHSTQRRPDIVRNYFREENVRYAAE
jgi:transposase